MSELKARTARSIADEEEMLELGADCPIESAQVYLKSESDKVIAELKDKLRHYPMMVALLESDKKEIAELKEEQRWRKFPDEKPNEEGYYIICGSSGFRNADKWTYCKDRQKMDFSFYSYGVAYWMPMPSAPKEVSNG